MKSFKLDFSKVLAIIITLSAIGILYINYFVKETPDEPLLPFILISMAIVFFFRKSSPQTEKLNLSKKNTRIMLSTAIITLAGGIVALLFTIF